MSNKLNSDGGVGHLVGVVALKNMNCHLTDASFTVLAKDGLFANESVRRNDSLTRTN